MPTRKFTLDQLMNKKLTKWIASILGLSKKELTTNDINKEIKTRYKDVISNEFSGGLNQRTVLDYLNKMHSFQLVEKKITKNNVALWKKGTRAIPFEKILINQDIEIIERYGKLSYDLLEGGQIRIYGHLINSGNMQDREDIKERYQKTIDYFKRGLAELESLRVDLLSENMTYLGLLELVRDKKVPHLDLELLLIIFYFANYAENLKEEDVNCFSKWFGIKNRKIVVNPDKKLVNIFQKHFYPKKKKDEISSMLDNYELHEDISKAMYFIHRYKLLQYIPFTVIIHSFGGRTDSLSYDIKIKMNQYMKSLKSDFSDVFEKPPMESLDELIKESYDVYNDLISTENSYPKDVPSEINNIDDFISLNKRIFSRTLNDINEKVKDVEK